EGWAHGCARISLRAARSRRSASFAGVESLRELLDLPLGGGELAGAAAVELFAPLPELRELLELDVTALEPLDDPLELGLRFLEGGLSTAAQGVLCDKL